MHSISDCSIFDTNMKTFGKTYIVSKGHLIWVYSSVTRLAKDRSKHIQVGPLELYRRLKKTGYPVTFKNGCRVYLTEMNSPNELEIDYHEF